MKVSILINNYNYGRYLKECIDSALSQTYDNCEVIVYDDGSTDDSVEIIKSYGRQITHILSDNFGKKPSFNQGNAINKAFSISRGDIISLLDSDDVFTPNKIERVVKIFKEDEENLAVQNDYFCIVDNVKSNIIESMTKGIVDYSKVYRRNRWTGYFNPTSCHSFRRTYLDEVLPLEIDNYWRVWPDVRLIRIVPFHGKIVNLRLGLTGYRKHGNNDSSYMNRDAKNTLLNQTEHHEYINKVLKDKGMKMINYKYSLPYLKHFIKSILY